MCSKCHLQCSIPAFEGLLPEPHNTLVRTLLYCAAEWHAFAKLRLHTESTLNHLEELTTRLGRLVRKFRDVTKSVFATFELPRETQAWKRRSKGKEPATPRVRAESQRLSISLPTNGMHSQIMSVPSVFLVGQMDFRRNWWVIHMIS